jgi:predicted aspartyl protease
MLTRRRLLSYTAFAIAAHASQTTAHAMRPLIESDGSKLDGLMSGEAKGRLDMSEQSNSIAVPLIVEGNVPIVELELQTASGAPRKARFLIDTGGDAFLIGSTLMADTGAIPMGPKLKKGDGRYVLLRPLPARLGGRELNLSGVQMIGLPDRKWVLSRNEAEGMIPSNLLRNYDVVFDYPGRQFILAKPGTSRPRGVSLKTPISTLAGFPRIEVEIGGKTYGFLLDTGGSFTMISRTVVDRWIKEDPAWPTAVGAVGFANMFGGEVENGALMLRIPELRLGTLALKGVAAVSRPEGNFEKSMSDLMTAPIIGALAGNVLRDFRVEIDYQNGLTQLVQSGTSPDADLVSVGLVLRAEPDGTLAITAVCSTASSDVKEGVLPGDKLLAVDDASLTGKPLAAAAMALQGETGTRKRLIVERHGESLTVTVKTMALL